MTDTLSWDLTAAALLLALALSLTIAWVYRLTYEGLSYLRSFAQTLALGGVVSALVVMAIGGNLARGIGLVGVLTLIRFRATLRDTRDLIFVFASLGVGVACGALAFVVAIMGTLLFCAAAFYVSWSPFASRRPFDAVLRVRFPSSSHEPDFERVLHDHCREFVLVDLREAGSVREQSYHVRLANPDRKGTLVRDLESAAQDAEVLLMMRDGSLEV